MVMEKKDIVYINSDSFLEYRISIYKRNGGFMYSQKI